MYEALLRERMDAEQTEEFDLALEQASGSDDVHEKAALLQTWGGDVVLT